VRKNPAAQVRFVNSLGSVTAPGVLPREFALLEMIAELSNGHWAGIPCSAIGVDFRNQPYYRAPRGILIRVSLDCADGFFFGKDAFRQRRLQTTETAKLRDLAYD
jgi:hypothetical protein